MTRTLSWIVIGGFAAWSSLGSAQGIQLEAGPTLEVVGPRSLATADLDSDGFLDIVVASPAVHSIVVAEGDGQGGLETPRFFDCIFPHHVTTADVDGNGHLDLVSANFLDGSVSYALGDGLGNFSAMEYLDGGGSPIAVAPGDFDEDGILDLAYADHGQGRIAILTGQGGGGFGDPVEVLSLTQASFVIAVDLDLDGHLDLAATSSGSSTFSITYGDGDGSFPITVPFAIGVDDSLWFIAAKDLDGDELPDLILPCPNADLLAIYWGLGLYYEFPVFFDTGAYPWQTRVRDLDLDGHLDLVTVNADSGEISVNRGDDGGAFAEPELFSAGLTSVAIVSGDFDADQLDDLVVADEGSGVITLYWNRSDQAAPAFERGDVDRDGSHTIADPVLLLERLFSPGITLECADAADLDDDGQLLLGDAIALLGALFGGPPAGPVGCQTDETADDLPECTIVSGLCP